jgi:hypothetical protein
MAAMGCFLWAVDTNANDDGRRDGFLLCDAEDMFEQPAPSGQLPRPAVVARNREFKEFRRAL